MPDSWLKGWKKIAKYLDVSVRTAQTYPGKGYPIYIKGGVRAKPSELDNFIKSVNKLPNSA